MAAADLQGLENLQGELGKLQVNIEEQGIFITNLLKKTQDISREARQMLQKPNRIISKLEKSTDVAVYKIFNTEIERKHKHAENAYKSCKKSVKEGKIVSRIDKVIDHYVKRQQVPDPEMHQYLLQVERKIGEIAVLIKNVYNIDWLYLILIGIAFGLALTWRNAKKAEKRHFL